MWSHYTCQVQTTSWHLETWVLRFVTAHISLETEVGSPPLSLININLDKLCMSSMVRVVVCVAADNCHTHMGRLNDDREIHSFAESRMGEDVDKITPAYIENSFHGKNTVLVRLRETIVLWGCGSSCSQPHLPLPFHRRILHQNMVKVSLAEPDSHTKTRFLCESLATRD